jgi:histidinol-phosphate/aromatic aminotransferase/cobyric acid decarboxylase-like protein
MGILIYPLINYYYVIKTNLNFGTPYEFAAEKHQVEVAIAECLAIRKENLQLTNGANGALEMILSALRIQRYEQNKPATALIDVPNYFDTLKFLQANNYELSAIPRDENLAFPTEAFQEAVSTNPHLIMLTSPNNPTGEVIPDKTLFDIIKAADESIVVIDRTCLSLDEEVSTEQLLRDFSGKRLIVIESYSKTHGFAADRIGYFAVANDELGDYLRKFEDDGRVSGPAIEKVKAMLEGNLEVIGYHKEKIRRSGDAMILFAQANNLFYTPPVSNFIVVELDPQKAAKLKEQFDFPEVDERFGQNYPGLYRLNLSEPEKVEEFIEAYNKITLVTPW